MVDFKTLREVEILKSNDRQKISIAEDMDGKRYLKREIEGDKREIYKALKMLNHKSIPKIYYVGFDDKTTVVEEYVNGVSLSRLTEKGTVLSQKQICSVALQVLSALEALHGAGIIHRDIKPDNIMADTNLNVWLADYDIARIYREEVRKDTEAMGTFGYAPIEQYGMMPTDFKTDIYAFGVTLKALLDRSGVKGFLHKIADKCKRMDPEQRYKSAVRVKRAIMLHKLKPLIILPLLVLAIVILIVSCRTDKAQNAPSVNNSVTDNPVSDIPKNEEAEDLVRFTDFTMPKNYTNYSSLENFETTAIFSGEGVWHYLPLMDDMQTGGIILLGKNHNTRVGAEITLINGVLSVALFDELGHSFVRDFYNDGSHSFNVTYPDNRRVNGELVCHDMDGDGVEELLIGISDCSVTVTSASIYQYFNYTIGWVLKYDESRGFILCEGDMFSENSKLVLVEGDLRVHLPYEASNTHDRAGYKLEGNKIIPFDV